MKRLILAVAAAALAATAPARAADPRHPDWPCQQIKVPTLSVAAFWTEPSIDGVGDAWQKDPAVQDLVQRLAARRTPLDEAEKAAGAFVTGTQAEKQKKAALLFAGLFATLNHERSEVMDGIERFSHRQQQLRDKIRTELTNLRQRQDATPASANQDAAHPDTALDKLGEQVAWDTRIFDERRHTIGYVCEVPATIERRLFSLARAIQQAME
jgi:hypothetical protein